MFDRVLNMPIFLKWQSSESCGVFNMQELHSVLNMPEDALSSEYISGFYICHNMPEFV